MNLPNWLTITRILMIPVFILFFYTGIPYWNFYAALVFVLAFITDILDGQIARRKNHISDFGKLMDPIADKMLVASALIMMCSFDMLSPIAAVIILSREFVVSGFRAFAAANGCVIAAGALGKLKTIFQAIALTLLLLENFLFEDIGVPMADIMLWTAVVLTVVSGIHYIYQGRHLFKKGEAES
ncbi:MAG: CDP-diacylglycerol--glycerol-3-phosphate 3-phosphatidyltransferase [Christensenellales bacterium]|jgi:CDP-diacylglycerol--glycerol-3-phosphate 3-phosphatidyltransferase